MKVRMGEIVRELKVPRTTIKFYTDLGLLKLKGKTKAGYYLYEPEETINRYQTITKLKKKRLTLYEIRDRLNKV